MSNCKSCGAEMRWAVTEAGKVIPLDAEPVEDGNLVMTGLNVGGDVQVRYVRQGEKLPPLAPRYVGHFVTCPSAGEHRKRRAS